MRIVMAMFKMTYLMPESETPQMIGSLLFVSRKLFRSKKSN